MSLSPRALTCLVLAHVVASLLHFADNAARFDHYHDEATLLSPTSVVVAWFLQTALGLVGLFLTLRGQRAGRPILMAYGILGFAGLLHYAAPPTHAMGLWMHVLIALEAATGLALLVASRFGVKPDS